MQMDTIALGAPNTLNHMISLLVDFVMLVITVQEVKKTHALKVLMLL